MSHNHESNPLRQALQGIFPGTTYGTPAQCALCGGDPFIKDEAGLIITECEECRKAGRLG